MLFKDPLAGNALKLALLTSPVIAASIVTPMFLVINGRIEGYFLVLFLVSLGTFLCWAINLFFIQKKQLHRFLIALTAMQLWGLVIFTFWENPTRLPTSQFHTLRIIYMVIINIVVSLLLEFHLTNQKKSELENKNHSLSLAKVKNEIQNLKNQINPHFLFNTLSTLKSLVKRDPGMAEEYVVKLADFLRKGISQKDSLVSIKEEIQLCSEYTLLQKMRFNDGLHVELNIDKEIYGNKIPFFAVQSLIENAIKHNEISNETPLKICISNTGEDIIVSNNLSQKHFLKESTQTGLHNLNKLMLLFGGEEIIIKETASAFSVQVKSLKI